MVLRQVRKRHTATQRYIASQWGQTDVMKYLLLAMSIKSVNLRNDVGQTALHVAVAHRQAASVALLTSHATCDVIAQDANHRTALRTLVMVYEPGTHASSCSCADDNSCSCYTGQTTNEAAILRLLLRRSLPVVHARRRVCSLNN